MKNIILLVALICISVVLPAQEKQVAITVDDLPFIFNNKFSISEVEQHTQTFLNKLDYQNVKALCFINGESVLFLGETDKRLSLLEQWLKREHQLANHTYSHLSLHDVSLKDFEEDCIKNEVVLDLLLDKYPNATKYFRYPYLRTGSDSIRKYGSEHFLASRGYVVVPVTIDNDDYIFNKVYTDAFLKNDTTAMIRTAEEYIKYTNAMISYYEQLSDLVAGRQIKQLFLSHANLINAHHIDKVLLCFKKHGYSFITAEEALSDPIYERRDSLLIPWGWTQLERWVKIDKLKKGAIKAPMIDKAILDAFENNT